MIENEVLFPYWDQNEIFRPVSFASYLFLIVLGAICLICTVVAPVSADGNLTNITPPEPVILSFMGGHMFGENPVEILDNETGRIAFVGDTGSKWVNLSPERGYRIRVEPAGVSDAANSPDAGVVGLMKWADKNPFGTFVYTTFIAACLIAFKKRRKT